MEIQLGFGGMAYGWYRVSFQNLPIPGTTTRRDINHRTSFTLTITIFITITITAGITLFGNFPNLGGPQYRPQNTIILIVGTPKMVPLILGNPHLGSSAEALALSGRKLSDGLAAERDGRQGRGGKAAPVLQPDFGGSLQLEVPFWRSP